MSGKNSCDCVGCSRSGGHQDHSCFSGSFSITVSHVCRPLFMTNQNYFQFWSINQCIKNWHTCTTRISENILNSLFFQDFNYDLSTIHMRFYVNVLYNVEFYLKFITIWMSVQDKKQTLLNKLDY